jgi:Na+-transporting NADH:ubiquinone oxidoreductase subunit NqrE
LLLCCCFQGLILKHLGKASVLASMALSAFRGMTTLILAADVISTGSVFGIDVFQSILIMIAATLTWYTYTYTHIHIHV